MLKKIILSFLILTILTGMNITQAEAKVRLKYIYKKGQTLKYRLTMRTKIDMQSKDMPNNHQKNNMSMQVDISQKVLAVNKHGVAKLMHTIDGGKIFSDGKPTPLPDVGKATYMMVNPQGEVLKKAGDQITSKQFADMNIQFPDKSLSVGEEWVIKKRVEIQKGVFADVIITNKLLAFETIKGQKCAKIKSDIRIDSNKGKPQKVMGIEKMNVEGSATMYFNKAKGHLVSTNADSQMEMKVSILNQGKKMNMAWKMKMNMKFDLQK